MLSHPTFSRLTPLDRLLIGYAIYVGLFIAFNYSTSRRVAPLLAAHAIIVLVIFALPARGSEWERRRSGESLVRTGARQVLRFLRHMYPLGLVIFFFEEVRYFVNSLWADNPYWFEPILYAADEAIFSGSPVVLLNSLVGMPQDEIMHFFYFSYYLVVLGGGSFAYIGMPVSKEPPAQGFERAITSVTAAFLFAFVWYPYLPARGPWENPELMAGLTPFQGFVFTSWIETIIAHGAVSGGCFPSAHVAGAFGMSFGLLKHHPVAGRLCLFLAIGMAASCVYTRYHHAVDIVAGLVCAALGYAFARRVTGRRATRMPALERPIG
jgi:membrane-associated phospholipid phosphatase